MDLTSIIELFGENLKEFDSISPVHSKFRPGIGPFGEPQIIKELSNRLNGKGIISKTHRTPDLSIGNDWAIEFKIVRPYGDNGKEAENWSVNLLHPYPGNISLLGDCLKLQNLSSYSYRAVIALGYEHCLSNPKRISLDPLVLSFELLAAKVMDIKLSKRIEKTYGPLVHPEHQVLRIIGWQVLESN